MRRWMELRRFFARCEALQEHRAVPRSISCDIEGKAVTVEYDDGKTKPQEMWDKMKKWADAAGKELGPCPE